MQTTNLLPLRAPDGRVSFASYRDDEEKQRILSWARAHGLEVDERQPVDKQLLI